MVLRNFLRFGFLYGFCLALTPLVCAQLPKRLEPCVPYPTFAAEIQQAKQVAFEAAETEPNKPTIVVDSVHFIGAPDLSPERASKLIAWVKGLHPYWGDDDWWTGAFSDYLKFELRDQGYIRDEVVSKYRVLKTGGGRKHVVLIAVVKEDTQYRLNDLHFRGNTAFPSGQLRRLISLRQGDVVDASKVREGLEALQKLYRSHGYIDMVPEPITDFDDHAGTINLTISIDEQLSYRIQELEVFGPDPHTEELIRSEFKVGETFDRSVLDNIFVEYKSVLPADVSERDVEIRRNTKDATVSVRLDFQTCAQLEN